MPREEDFQRADTWFEKMVTSDLARIEKRLEKLEETVHQLREDFREQRVKVGLYGAIAGGVPGLIAAAAIWFGR